MLNASLFTLFTRDVVVLFANVYTTHLERKAAESWVEPSFSAQMEELRPTGVAVVFVDVASGKQRSRGMKSSLDRSCTTTETPLLWLSDYNITPQRNK